MAIRPAVYDGILEHRRTIESLLTVANCPKVELSWEARDIEPGRSGIYFIWAGIIWEGDKMLGFQLDYIGQSRDARKRLSGNHKACLPCAYEVIGFTEVPKQDRREAVELWLIGLINPPKNIIGRTDI